jgi:hypothetical protein
MATWIPVDFDIFSPDWLLRNHLSRLFTTNPCIRRVFIDPERPNVVGITRTTDIPPTMVNLRSWTYFDLHRPVQNNSNNESTNGWNFSEINL